LELVLTAQNRIPIIDTIQVIAPDTPYLLAANPVVDDSASWNPNGQVDFGEAVLMSFTLRNVGLLTAQDLTVTVASSDWFATVDSRFVSLDQLAPDSSATVDSFTVHLNGDCPDGRQIQLEAIITDNAGNTWSSPLRFTVHAPVLSSASIAVDDGNNGRLDINEIADIVVNFANTGSCFVPDGNAQLTSLDPYVAIITPDMALNPILADSSGEATFGIRVLPTTPPGHEFRFQWTLSADHGFSTFGSFQLPAGLIIEDFETGDFSGFDWTFSGNADWHITSSPVWEGSFSAVSGNVSDDQFSSLVLNVTSLGEREVRFTLKVSSEANYDGLEFYIDNTRYGPWQGEIDWQEVTFPVAAGDHTLTWKYVKDQGVSEGSDCAWVDFIVLPLVGPSGFHCIPGDVNGDDQVTVLDIFRMVFMVLDQGLTPTDEETYCADVNYDGIVDIFDVLEAGDRRSDQ
ncbi:MAG: dockerin type I domain-containing protein, partial [Fidelibacterota bacterium]